MAKRLVTAVVVITLGTTFWMRWNRSKHASESPLIIRRVAPEGNVLRGEPQRLVQVELELVNTTEEPIKLAPLRMGCSCQVVKGPDSILPAKGVTNIVLKLRYPPAMRTVVVVPINSASGTELARAEIVLETNQDPPYFTHVPDRIDIHLIEGVTDGTWNASASTVEYANQKPHVTECEIVSGSQWMDMSWEMAENGVSGFLERQRTYHLSFQLKPEGWDELSRRRSLHGQVVLKLSDGTKRSIPWKLTIKPPLLLVYDAKTRKIRGLRRGGAKGRVALYCLPSGSGRPIPDSFDEGQSIEAHVELNDSVTSIEAEYEGLHGPVRISLDLQ